MRNFYGVFVDYPKGKGGTGGYGRTRPAHPIRSHIFCLLSYAPPTSRHITPESLIFYFRSAK